MPDDISKDIGPAVVAPDEATDAPEVTLNEHQKRELLGIGIGRCTPPAPAQN